MHATPALMFAAVAVVAVVGGYLRWRAEQRRRALLISFAANNRWDYVARDDAYCTRWDGPPFGAGDHRAARNVLTGTYEGRPMVAFDYSYQTHSSDGQGNRTTTTHRFAVRALELPTYLPALAVTPESLLTRFGDALGLTDIHLESEDFNRRFRVKARDAKFAYDVLSARTMELLLARRPAHWRIDGTAIVCWDDGEGSPAEILERLSLLAAIVANIPDFVWRDHGVAPGPATAGGTA